MKDKVKKIGFIYALIDPVTLQVRYVGQTHKPVEVRCAEHLAMAKKKKKDGHYKDPSHRASWMRKSKFKFYKMTLETLPVDQLDKAEIKWIKFYRDRGYPLTNMTDGGEGNRGFKFSKAQIKTLSLAHIGTNLGPRPLSVGKKISKTKKEFYKTNPHHKAGVPNTVEQNKKIGLANSGNRHTTTFKQDQSKRLKAWNKKNPDARRGPNNPNWQTKRTKKQKISQRAWMLNYLRTHKHPSIGTKQSKKRVDHRREMVKNTWALRRSLKYQVSSPVGIKFNPKQAVLHKLSPKQLAILAS